MKIRRILLRSAATFVVLPLLLTQISCQQTSGNSAMEGDGSDVFGTNPFGSNSYDDLGSGLGGASLGGSGTSGGLTDTDKQALQAVFAESEEVNPDEDIALSSALQAEAERILAAEKQGQQVTQQKMMLAAKMLQECANQVADLAPIPGQPLIGKWNGGGACAVDFEITPVAQQGLYKVSGGTTGQMKVDATGAGMVEGKPFAGTLTDQPNSGKGSLTHPTFHQDKNGATACKVEVTLKTSRNPIPENYVEAMRKAGKCYRQTLMLMSPTMSGLFDKMDPALAQILQSRILGIGK